MANVQQVSNASIRMGEMSVATTGRSLRTLLGSCIGVALHDRQRQIGGLAHIVLPCARGNGDRPGKYVDTAIPLLIARMQELADDRLKLSAKIAGGASMFGSSRSNREGLPNIGLQNIQACERLLGELDIPIIGRDCGGEKGRRMSLDPTDGSVLIEVVGQATIRL